MQIIRDAFRMATEEIPFFSGGRYVEECGFNVDPRLGMDCIGKANALAEFLKGEVDSTRLIKCEQGPHTALLVSKNGQLYFCDSTMLHWDPLLIKRQNEIGFIPAECYAYPIIGDFPSLLRVTPLGPNSFREQLLIWMYGRYVCKHAYSYFLGQPSDGPVTASHMLAFDDGREFIYKCTGSDNLVKIAGLRTNGATQRILRERWTGSNLEKSYCEGARGFDVAISSLADDLRLSVEEVMGQFERGRQCYETIRAGLRR